MSSRLHLVRHGESTWNLAGRVQGQAIGPVLTALGRTQAKGAAAHLLGLLPSDRPVLVVTSDLDRAAQTAEIISSAMVAAGRRASSRREPRLREQAAGEMEGRFARDLSAQPVPSGVDISDVRWGGGESVHDVWRRAASWVQEARDGTPEGSEVVVVSHEHTLRALLAALDGRDHRSVDWSSPLPPGSVRSAPLRA